MARIVGIDFGTVRIGIAISDERKIIASALPTLTCAKTLPQTIDLLIKALSGYTAIEKIVIGLPLLLSGKEGDMAQKVKAFGTLLQEKMGIPVVYWDERLSSAFVEKMLISADVSRKKRASLSDALSAVTILQNYLESLPPRT
ncbi:MAG: Holliday junction resolvase RuvX [Verrucomicrobia bacterium]|nr:Holliday junction resolvase RuvX [Verrucomicrobiota bacterium]